MGAGNSTREGKGRQNFRILQDCLLKIGFFVDHPFAATYVSTQKVATMGFTAWQRMP